MADSKRLIEEAFPLEQASLDSAHEKSVRHGHISTLHIWPARRPLAACRAALIATLLPSPESEDDRRKLCERIGGKVVKVMKKKNLPGGKVEEREARETVGGILHWSRESSPDLEWFRQEIKTAYGGRAPKVLDPFAGGGAIPLEAMRLGCEATAIDINPVAWFILKCTLEYPQKLAGQYRPLPKFALESPEFMREYFKATTKLTKKQLERNLHAVQTNIFPAQDVDPSWHVRAWGWWVLEQAKRELERFYPVVDGKPTVAYLWARTVTCKNCRATIPLLKTRWLCKKDKKRVLLTVEPNKGKTGVVFGIQDRVPAVGKGAALREHDKRVGAGTMSRSGAYCPCCGKPGTAQMTMEDIRLEGQAGRLGSMMTAVVVDGESGKEYRLPTKGEVRLVAEAEKEIDHVFADIPFGIPNEPLASKEALGFRVPLYGFNTWNKLFTPRQLLAMGTFVKHTRVAFKAMKAGGYPAEWADGAIGFLALAVDRLADYSSALCMWHTGGEKLSHTFTRFALPAVWDYCEVNVLSETTGGFLGGLDWVARVVSANLKSLAKSPPPLVVATSATQGRGHGIYDAIVTDPPYYDAIPYSDAMDFFYVWLKRVLHGVSADVDTAFADLTSPKWDTAKNDGELIDDASRFGGDGEKSKQVYEDGMYRAFAACRSALTPNGRLVVVFANKQPAAWETLVSSMIRAGFVVDGSWPIQTEMNTRMRAKESAALSSSVWLVCRKRGEDATPGWDNKVLEEMRENITKRLREFWDAGGIKGPDFVWAATGPALEAYSKHPVVKKANEPGQAMTVSEFLKQVRRMVVDFAVGRVLPHDGDTDAATGLDNPTTYYLLHRAYFGLGEAPAGAAILYAVSCDLRDSDLVSKYDLLAHAGKAEPDKEASEDEGDEEEQIGSGGMVKLKQWNQRKREGMGYPGPHGEPLPMIDHVHRLMHHWHNGDVVKVNEYLDSNQLRKDALFVQLLQALIEMSAEGSEEKTLLEKLSNHIGAKGALLDRKQPVDRQRRLKL